MRSAESVKTKKSIVTLIHLLCIYPVCKSAMSKGTRLGEHVSKKIKLHSSFVTLVLAFKSYQTDNSRDASEFEGSRIKNRAHQSIELNVDDA